MKCEKNINFSNKLGRNKREIQTNTQRFRGNPKNERRSNISTINKESDSLFENMKEIHEMKEKHETGGTASDVTIVKSKLVLLKGNGSYLDKDKKRPYRYPRESLT